MADPYKVLGVAKTASDDDIKKAYRRLAKRLHPDLNPGNKKVEPQFRELTAAYDFISDPENRRRYDRGEIDETGTLRPAFWASRGGDPRGGDPRGGDSRGGGAGRGGRPHDAGLDPDEEDLFRDFFGFGKGRTTVKMRGADVTYKAEVDFLDAVQGAKKRLTLSDGKTLDVNIPPGTEDGQTLRLKGQGLPGQGGAANGDAFVEISVRPHAFFEREGRDILLECPISLTEAILGGTITVPTVDGKVALKVPKHSNTGTQLRLKGKGVQDAKAGKAGDLYIRFVVVLPKEIDPELEQAVERWTKSHGYGYSVRDKLIKE
jgi:DnaJ-class molecular chaperone